MILITKTTKYMARARKTPDFSNKIPGYDFSYPVLNTIDIAFDYVHKIRRYVQLGEL